MTHPSTRTQDPARTPSLPSPEAIALDRALDAWVSGDAASLDALDPLLGETVAQLYAWADVAGLPAETAPSPVAMLDGVRADVALPVPSRPPRPNRKPETSGVSDRCARAHPWRYRIMTGFSGLAAALLIGLSIYGAVPIFTQHDQSPTATLEATSMLASGGGDSSPSPTLTVGNSQQPTNWVVPPLTEKVCSAAPRSREEMLGILSTPPAPGSDLFVGNTSIDQPTLDAVNETLRGWWACMLFGKPWQAMSFESDQYLRELFYGDPRVSKAFSPSTINELLDAREQVAASGQQFRQEYGTEWLVVLAVSDAVITPDQVPVRSVEADVYWFSAYSGDVSDNKTLLIEFVWEDGGWKIRAIHNPHGASMPMQK